MYISKVTTQHEQRQTRQQPVAYARFYHGGVQREGRKRDGFLGRQQLAYSHQLGDLGYTVSSPLPSGVRGGAPAAQWFSYILSALDGVSQCPICRGGWGFPRSTLPTLFPASSPSIWALGSILTPSVQVVIGCHLLEHTTCLNTV